MAFDKSNDDDKSTKQVSPTNDSWNQDLDKLVDNVHDLGTNVTSLTRKLLSYSNESLGDLNDRAKNWFHQRDDVRSQEFKDGCQALISDLAPRIDDLMPKASELKSFFGGFVDDDGDIGNNFFGSFHPWFGNHETRFGGSFRKGQTPFGFYSYRVPSTKYYNECQHKQGESVWDSKGYWRCLFPNSEVPSEFLDYKQQHLAKQILTKEDFNDALSEQKQATSNPDSNGVIDLGDQGTFFRGFDAYLNWKSIMYDNIKHERAQRRQSFIGNRKSQLEAWHNNWHAKHDTNDNAADSSLVKQQDPLSNDTPAARSVISSSVQSSYKSDSDTNEIVLHETRTEHFSDGTSLTKNITKSKPFGATEWANISENVDQGAFDSFGTDDGNKAGWFWKKD